MDKNAGPIEMHAAIVPSDPDDPSHPPAKNAGSDVLDVGVEALSDGIGALLDW